MLMMMECWMIVTAIILTPISRGWDRSLLYRSLIPAGIQLPIYSSTNSASKLLWLITCGRSGPTGPR